MNHRLIYKRPRLAGLAAALMMLAPGPLRAIWYQENIANGSDLIMMDLRWPWWPSGTYYANWNTSFNPKPNNVSFYAGFLGTVPDGPGGIPNPDEKVQSAFRPGSVWSFWGNGADGTPVRFTDVAPNLYIKNDYGGEGCSGSLGSDPWPFVTWKRWYTMLGRVWRPVEPDATHAYIGRWIKDQAAGRWHLIGIARLPIPATSFSGNSGFIETLSDGIVVRPLHRRFGYCRKDGTWLKADTITINETPYALANILPEGDHEYAAIEYAAKTDLLPRHIKGKPLAAGDSHVFKTKQPDLPALDNPAVGQVRAETTGRQVGVSWEVPVTASPAFAYKIEVFANPDCRGEAAAVKEERMPTARHALIDAAVPVPTIRLTLTDIFDQQGPPVIVTAVASKAPAPAKAAPAGVPGLAYELFHKDSKRKESYFGAPQNEARQPTLGDLVDGKLFRRGLARGFDLGVLEQRGSGYALAFNGLLRVPETGLYVFLAQIDGGYRLRLDGAELLARDGQQGTTEKAAMSHLSNGDHSLTVEYIYDHLPTKNFRIDWEGPRLPRQAIPLDALRVADAGAYPLPTVKAEAPGDGTGKVTVQVEARGHKINKIALFLGQLQLAESAGGQALKYEGPLPRGAVTLWARVIHDENQSVDSAPAVVDVTGKPVDASWTVRNVSDAKASAGLWQTGPQAFRFFGNGMHTATRQLTGDFTATCRIDAYNGSRGEPVNGRAWVGLTAREHGDRLNWEWGRDFHLVQTAREGLRVSADFSDLGAGRLASYALPANRPWIRIVRQGPVWTAWSSADGKLWELGGYQHKPTRPQMDVGLFFSALPQDARAHYHASVSELSVVPGVLPESTPPPPVTAKHTAGARLTGVAMARSDAKVVVVRSSAAGLLRSTDGGKTWAAANGKLGGDDLAVRSVAIHPTDPLVMLRAGGRGTGGGLWKTTDGGRNWVKLAFPGNFDGAGPSALCGEVIAFDLRAPETVYVGCESKGFFKSADGGATWKLLGLAGQRVTAVRVWAWERFYPALAAGTTQLCVTTCPDRWMSYLGRGKPAVATGETKARTYVSNDNVQTLVVLDEREDTGFTNVAWDKSLQSTREISYATVHGYQGNSGGHMSLFPAVKNFEWLRPVTALGTTARGEQRMGRFLTQALDPEVPGRLSQGTGGWGMDWAWLPAKGAVPKGGLIAACGEHAQGDQWWFVHTDGLYFSPDGGATLSKVLDESGRK
jgi:hypothetical protein